MAFINFPSPTPVFPALPTVAWSVHKKPLLASRAITAATGRSVQVACAGYPRWAFTLTYNVLRDQTQNSTPDPTLAGFTEFEQLSSLFLACLGAYGEFYFDDPDDDSRTNVYIGAGTGTLTTFPILCTWGFGPFSPAMYFVVGGIKTIDAVYLDGVLQSNTTYGVDSTNTQLVFTSAPASNSAVTISYHFYFRCRFLDDTFKFSQFVRNKWQCTEVRFESVKP